MIPLRLAEVAAACRGRLSADADPDARVTGDVEFDSRRIGPGGLFVALTGEYADGHAFVPAALRAGAVAALASRPVDGPAVLVDDPLAALGRLAHAVLDRLPEVTVVGITGSVGKTTTKDLVAALLRTVGPTVAPPGSFNNEIGQPYTVLRATAQTRTLVLEYSARGIGHIADLAAIARPRIAVELNVGSAHIGEFGSREAVARAKGELVEALSADGVAILNADDPLVLGMRSRTDARVVTVGRAADADLRALDVTLDGSGRASYTAVGDGERVPVRLALVGEHQVANSLAALAAAREAGLALSDAAAVLARTGPASRWRMEVTDTPDGVTIVNDAYNANPESVRAALRALAVLAEGRRSVAVLGAMAELGEEAGAAHEAVGRLAADLGVDRLVVVGPGAVGVHTAAERESSWKGTSVTVPDIDTAVLALRDEVRAGDVVLIKASRAAGLERVAAALLASTGGRG